LVLDHDVHLLPEAARRPDGPVLKPDITMIDF
jgi:hypothetical protein